LVLVGALLSVAVMLALPVRSWLGQEAQLSELDAAIVAARERVSDLEVQRERWQDPSYIADQARLRLNMVRPGEMGLIILDPDAKPDVARPESGAAATWYQRLWQSARNPGRPVPPTQDLDDETAAPQQ
jgi:cell division protein FtsB